MNPPPRPPSPLAGVLPVVQTPFGDDLTVDLSQLRDEAEWVAEQGAAGLVIGMVSEVLRLDELERVAQVATLAEVTGARRLALIASVGAESTSHARARARAAADAGATALMATPPLALEASDEQLRRYFGDIAAATPLPLVVQDASGYVGRPLSMELQVALVADLGGQVLFKPEAHPIGARVSQLRDGTGGRARIIEGSGGIALMDTYRRGIVATMPAADLSWALVALWEALERGDDDLAQAIHAPLSAMIALQSSLDMFVAIEKHLLVRQGIFRNARLRPPVSLELDPETILEVNRLADLIRDAVPKPLVTVGA